MDKLDVAYIESMIAGPGITEEARATIRGFIPKKSEIVHGFIILDWAELLKRLDENGYTDIVRITGENSQHLRNLIRIPVRNFYFEAQFNALFNNKLIIKEILYISTPDGLDFPFCDMKKYNCYARYCILPVSDDVKDKLIRDGIIEPRTILVKPGFNPWKMWDGVANCS